MKSTPGRDRCMAMRWTQWPTWAVGSGMPSDWSPLLMGRHVTPASSLRKAPAAEMATNIRPGWLGSSTIVCRHMPPAPGCQSEADGCVRRPGSSCHVCPRVGGAEDRRVLDAGVDGVGIGERRLQVPDPREVPRVRRAVVPEVLAGGAVVDELVADGLPRLAAVARALDHLAEPARRLRRVEAVRVRRRALEVVDLPAAEVRTAHVPASARSVRRQDERALARADQHPYSAHPALLPGLRPISRQYSGRPLTG